jgi:hypothetical protein
VTAFKIDVLLNNKVYARTLANSRYMSYRVIKESFALKHSLTQYAIVLVPIWGYNRIEEQTTSEIVIMTIDIGDHKMKKTCFYII